MTSRSILRAGAVSLAGLLALTACGSDSTTSPTPVPDVSGVYYGTWTLQVLRKSDGFQTSFYCSGQWTLRSESTGSLTGFAVVDAPCAPESYPLTGTVSASGAVEYTTNAPPPTEGPCPGGQNVHFSGQITRSTNYSSFSSRGVTTVTCPAFGEHEFTYLMTGSR
jgi:hypothetical protein